MHLNGLFTIIKQILKKDEKAVKKDIEKVCDWMTLANDNILEALLYHFYEEECLRYMGYYSRFLNQNLF